MARLTPEQRAELTRLRELEEQEDAASEYDGDDFEWWEEGSDGNRRGARTTVRTARQHGPDWAKGFFAEQPKIEDAPQPKAAPKDDGKVRPAHFGGQRRTG